MDKVILVEINVRSKTRSYKVKGAQEKINEYIKENCLDVISVSLFKEDEDNYLFTLTLRWN